jgi:hypothetical protein
MRSRHRLFHLGAVVLSVIAYGCGGGGGTGIQPKAVVLGVTIAPNAPATIKTGETLNLSATVNAQNGASTAVTWSTSSAAVATVSGTGVVTGVASGQATITATSTFDATKSASVAVKVAQPTVAKFATHLDTLHPGQSRTYTATVTGDPGISTAVTWASSNTAAATVTQSGQVTAIARGSTTIRATSVADPTAYDEMSIVSDPCYVMPLAVGASTGTVNATITTLSCQGGADLYRYSLPTQTAFTVSMVAPIGEELASVVPKGQYWFASNSNGNGPYSLVQVAVAAAGKYHLNVAADNTLQPSDLLTYALTFSGYTTDQSVVANAATPCAPVYVTPNITQAFTTSSTCPPYTRIGLNGTFYSDSFYITPAMGQTQQIKITATSATFATMIDLFTANGATPLATATAAGPGQPATITYAPPQGAQLLWFVVTSAQPGQTGIFSLSIQGPSGFDLPSIANRPYDGVRRLEAARAGRR